jgi:hypothetical protein
MLPLKIGRVNHRKLRVNMTSDRLEWILNGINVDRLTSEELEFFKKVKKLNIFDLSPGQESKLEKLFKIKSR